MVSVHSVAQALACAKRNEFKDWNRSTSSSVRSDNHRDASHRVYDGFADVMPAYTGRRLDRDDAVFAMGSCFAREIENALVAKGGNIVSVDKTIQIPEFVDGKGLVRDSFFHRFTPRAMHQEFAASFGELPGWTDDSLMFPWGEQLLDLNYWNVTGADHMAAASHLRRRVAQQLVRNAKTARMVILTLGLIEGWRHKPSGFFTNRAYPALFNRNRDDFEFVKLDFADTMACLEGMRDILAKHCEHDIEIVVTVSPVPLSATFTSDDIVIANTRSKSTLRTAATEFAEAHANVHYFPSYEIVTHSSRDLAWRPDRIHVERAMVDFIVRRFVEHYYQPDALPLG